MDQNFKEFAERMQSVVQEALPDADAGIDHEIETETGGGMVKLILNKKGEVRQISIDPLLLDKENVHHLEQLLMGAMNDARQKFTEAFSKHAMQSMMNKQLGGLDLNKAMESVLKSLKP